MYSFQRYRSDYRELLKLGLPIMVGQLGIVIVGFMDNLMVGRYGMDDLAAVSFVNSIFSIPILFGLGFFYGLTPLIGQRFGTGDTSGIGELLKNGLLVNMAIGLLMILPIGAILLNVERMGRPAELLPLIRPYFALQLASLLFVMLFNGFKQYADGLPIHLMTVMAVVICDVFLMLRPFMGRIFNAPQEVCDTVSVLMLILLTLQVGDVFQVTYANALRGMNDVATMAVISFIGYFVLALPLCYVFGFILRDGVEGIWWGFPVGLLSAGLMMMGRYMTKLREEHG